MAATLLQCPNCHAPLPPPAGGFSVCPYCRATAAIGVGGAVSAAASPAPAPITPERSFDERKTTATQTFLRVLAQQGTPEQAAWYAAHDYGVKDPRDVWSGAVALARDFDARNETKVMSDASAMVRLFEGYASLIAEIRSRGQSEINMPFLSSNSSGPVHLQASHDATSIYELIQRCGPRQA